MPEMVLQIRRGCPSPSLVCVNKPASPITALAADGSYAGAERDAQQHVGLLQILADSGRSTRTSRTLDWKR